MDGGDDFIGLGGFAADLDRGVLVLDEAESGAEEGVVIGDADLGGLAFFGGGHGGFGFRVWGVGW